MKKILNLLRYFCISLRKDIFRYRYLLVVFLMVDFLAVAIFLGIKYLRVGQTFSEDKVYFSGGFDQSTPEIFPSVLTSTPILTPASMSTPTPEVFSSPFQYGISAGGSLTGMDQGELDLYFQELKELGVSWVRWDFDWSVIQADGPVSYNWVGTDRVVKSARKCGINTLGVITYSPVWARQSVCKESDKCAPVDPAAFGDFAGKVAARYKSWGIHHWEIWNEPNISFFWQPIPNVSVYVAILKSAYASIKKIDSMAFVLTGGLVAFDEGNNNISPTAFIRRLYKINITKDFDAVAFHPYTYPALASYRADWNGWQQMAAIRQLMIENGDGDKLIWVTEYGVPTGGPGGPRETTQLDGFVYDHDYMTEEAQAVMAADVLRLFSQARDGFGPFFWYSLKDEGTTRETPENFFGLLRFDGSKKPAYYQFQSAIKGSN